MTEQDRIFLLEEALIDAQNLVSFLHGCLTEPDRGEMRGGYEYGHPEQTLETLREWEELVPMPLSCPHSWPEDGCEGCRTAAERRRRMAQIRARREQP